MTGCFHAEVVRSGLKVLGPWVFCFWQIGAGGIRKGAFRLFGSVVSLGAWGRDEVEMLRLGNGGQNGAGADFCVRTGESLFF